MTLTCIQTGVQVETATDEAAERLLASGCFVKAAEKPAAKRAAKGTKEK